MSHRELPEVVWLGKVDGEWPVHAFVSADHAMHWLDQEMRQSTGYVCKKRVWEVQLHQAERTQVRLVKPEPYLDWVSEPAGESS